MTYAWHTQHPPGSWDGPGCVWIRQDWAADFGRELLGIQTLHIANIIVSASQCQSRCSAIDLVLVAPQKIPDRPDWIAFEEFSLIT